MPNRIIKESICTSEEIDILTPEQEVFFYRLMVVVDDFGLMDARLSILKAKCYPLKSIEINSIQLNLARLQEVGLVKLYQVDGKPFLSITKWANHQQIRAKRAKYPTPECGSEIICNQLKSDAPVIQSNPNPIQNPIQSNTPDKPARFDPLKLDLPEGLKPDLWAEWVSYRTKTGKALKPESWLKQVEFIAECIGKGFDPAEMFAHSIRNGYTGLFEPKTAQVASQFLTAQQRRDENNRRSTAEFLGDDVDPFTNTINGEYHHA